jgi:hypothetical protein
LGAFSEYKEVSASRHRAHGKGISSKVVPCKSVFSCDTDCRCRGAALRRAYDLDLVNHMEVNEKMIYDSVKSLAMAAFLFSCFGIIAGGAYHNDCAYLGLLGEERFRDALEVVQKYFQKLPLLYYAGMGIGFLLLAILIISGHTILPRWMFLLSPGILFLLRPAVARLPKGIRIIVSGGWTNWISIIYYLAVLISILL